MPSISAAFKPAGDLYREAAKCAGRNRKTAPLSARAIFRFPVQMDRLSDPLEGGDLLRDRNLRGQPFDAGGAEEAGDAFRLA